jgi:hypothetical protein
MLSIQSPTSKGRRSTVALRVVWVPVPIEKGTSRLATMSPHRPIGGLFRMTITTPTPIRRIRIGKLIFPIGGKEISMLRKSTKITIPNCNNTRRW